MDSVWIGVIGTVVGAVVGALIVLIPQSIGKLRITFCSVELSPINISGPISMQREIVCALSEAQYANIRFVADIHNSKAYPLSYRDVALEFICGDKRQTVSIQERQKSKEPELTYVLNQPSKTMVQYQFESRIIGEKLAILKDHNGKANYYLRLENHKGHQERFQILGIVTAKPQ